MPRGGYREGAGRPKPPEPLTHITVRLPGSLVDHLDEIRGEASRAHVLTGALREWLAKRYPHRYPGAQNGRGI